MPLVFLPYHVEHIFFCAKLCYAISFISSGKGDEMSYNAVMILTVGAVFDIHIFRFDWGSKSEHQLRHHDVMVMVMVMVTRRTLRYTSLLFTSP